MSKKLMFSELSPRLQGVFGDEERYEGYLKLNYDLIHNNEIIDEDGAKVSKAVANKTQLGFARQILGLGENPTKREIHRALKNNGREFFEVSEEEIDIQVETGFHESEFFNAYVEERNIARGDSVEFWTDQDIVLSAVKVAGDHHDFNCRVRVVKAA